MNSDSRIGMMYDEYRIEQALGSGGMATVFRAVDVKLQRYVALKVIAPELRDNPGHVRRFEREAQSIARLEHPHIVQIYRYGEANDSFYIAMQYIDGADLGKLIADYRSTGEVMPLGDVVRVVQEIAAALDYAHSRDVIHRDVKPSNIMVDSRGRALLTDFGLALLSDVGTLGEVFGSPHYISPEQTVSSANVTPQSDIYSLGITLFEMLTGEPPFTGSEALEISMHHLADPPPAPSQRNVTISPAIDAVVLRALEKEPGDRYLTGFEFSEALRTAVENSPQSRPSPYESTRRPSLVLLSQKVDPRQSAAPLPDNYSAPAPQSPFTTPTANPERATTVQISQRGCQPWLRAVIFAGVLFLVGIAFLLVLLQLRLAGGPLTNETLPPVPSATAVSIVVQPASPSPSLFSTITPSVTLTQEMLRQLAPAPPTTIPIISGAGQTVVPPAGNDVSSASLTPEQAVRQYYQLVSQHRYDQTWNLLTDAFKQEFNCCAPAYNYAGYVAWWDSVNRVEFGALYLMWQTTDQAVVYAELYYVMNNGQRSPMDSTPYISLLYDTATGIWLFNDKRDTP